MNGTTSINIINVGFIGKNIYKWWTFNGTSSNSWGSFPNLPMPPCLARVKKVRVNLGLVMVQSSNFSHSWPWGLPEVVKASLDPQNQWEFPAPSGKAGYVRKLRFVGDRSWAVS